MSPELITAIKERLQASQSKEEIESAVLAMGHTKEVFDAAYTLAEHDLQNKTATELPRARTLFKNAWGFAQTRFDLIALLFVPLALETLCSFWFERLPESERFTTPLLMLLAFVTAVLYLMTVTLALKVVAAKTEEEKTLPAATQWMLRHALPLLFVYVLSGLIIGAGLLFFIIPGLVIAISLTFAQYVFVGEEKTGMSALLASHALVKGRWFAVARKIFGFIVLTLVPLFLFGILYGIVTGITGEGVYVILGGELLTQAISAVMSLMSLYAMYHLYLALKERRENEAVDNTFVRLRYWVLVGIGVALVVGLIVVAIFFRDKLDWVEEVATPIETMETREAPATFSQFSETTLRFVNERNGSYLGVCESLRPLVEGEGDVVCNDSESAWAIQVTDSFGASFCADRKTPGKLTPAPIGTATECISVGE